MKITIPAKQTLAWLATTKPVWGANKFALVLGSALITVKDQAITMAITDLETYAETAISGISVEGERDPKAFAIDCKEMTAALKALKGKTATLEVSGDTATVNGFPVSLYSAVEFPLRPIMKPTMSGIMSGLAAAYGAIRHAVGDGDARYSLHGIKLDSEGVLVATDGHRLCVETFDQHPDGTAWHDAIIPKLPMSIIAKVFGDSEADVFQQQFPEPTTHAGCRFMLFQNDVTMVHVTCTDGQYPNFRQVIPSPNHPDHQSRRAIIAEFRVDTDAMLAAIKPLLAVATEKDAGVKLNGNTAEIKIGVANGAERIVTVPTPHDFGRIVINLRHFASALAARAGETVTYQTFDADHLAPVKLCGATGMEVLMPMRT